MASLGSIKVQHILWDSDKDPFGFNQWLVRSARSSILHRITSLELHVLKAQHELPALLRMDNAAAEVFTNNSANKTRLKHIDCRQEWVKMLRNKALIKPVHVPSEDNLADIFTKILPRTVFTNLRDRMMHKKPAAAV